MSQFLDELEKVRRDLSLLGLQDTQLRSLDECQKIIASLQVPRQTLDLAIESVDRGDEELFLFCAHHLLKQDSEELLGKLGEIAAYYDYREIITELVKRKIDPEHFLRGAAIGGQIDLIDRLLILGAPLDETIEMAAIGGQRDLLFHLLEKEGTSREYFNQAVHYAAGGDHQELVIELIELGACPRAAILGALKGQHMSLLVELMSRDLDRGPGKVGEVIGQEFHRKPGANPYGIHRRASQATPRRRKPEVSQATPRRRKPEVSQATPRRRANKHHKNKRGKRK